MIPLLLLALATVVGGWVNTVDLRGRVLDDFTDLGIKEAKLTHGSRTAIADESGNFEFPQLPRTSRLRVDAPGYLVAGAPTTQEEIRMMPLSVTVQVNEASNPEKHIANAEIRQGDKLLETTNEGGNKVVSPHPGKNAKLLICAAGYDMKEFEVRGVTAIVELTPGTNACPPLPTPSPSPSPSPTPSPAQTPSPTPTPSPTGT
jgi:hypothetical protein